MITGEMQKYTWKADWLICDETGDMWNDNRCMDAGFDWTVSREMVKSFRTSPLAPRTVLLQAFDSTRGQNAVC